MIHSWFLTAGSTSNSPNCVSIHTVVMSTLIVYQHWCWYAFFLVNQHTFQTSCIHEQFRQNILRWIFRLSYLAPCVRMTSETRHCKSCAVHSGPYSGASEKLHSTVLGTGLSSHEKAALPVTASLRWYWERLPKIYHCTQRDNAQCQAHHICDIIDYWCNTLSLKWYDAGTTFNVRVGSFAHFESLKHRF